MGLIKEVMIDIGSKAGMKTVIEGEKKAFRKATSAAIDEAINSNKFWGAIDELTGVPSVVSGAVSKKGLNNTLKDAGYYTTKMGKNAKGEMVEELDKLNLGKIAGGYIGASAVGRIASGGGVYKDGNGNTNMIGLPFI